MLSSNKMLCLLGSSHLLPEVGVGIPGMLRNGFTPKSDVQDFTLSNRVLEDFLNVLDSQIFLNTLFSTSKTMNKKVHAFCAFAFLSI